MDEIYELILIDTILDVQPELERVVAVCVCGLACPHPHKLESSQGRFLISHLTCLLFALALRVLHGGFERSNELLVN